MYTFDIILMDEKLTQLQRSPFELFLKIMVVSLPLIDKFSIF